MHVQDVSDVVQFLWTRNSTGYLPRNRSVIEDTISNPFVDKFINLFSLNVTKVIKTYIFAARVQRKIEIEGRKK